MKQKIKRDSKSYDICNMLEKGILQMMNGEHLFKEEFIDPLKYIRENLEIIDRPKDISAKHFCRNQRRDIGFCGSVAWAFLPTIKCTPSISWAGMPTLHMYHCTEVIRRQFL